MSAPCAAASRTSTSRARHRADRTAIARSDRRAPTPRAAPGTPRRACRSPDPGCGAQPGVDELALDLRCCAPCTARRAWSLASPRAFATLRAGARAAPHSRVAGATASCNAIRCAPTRRVDRTPRCRPTRASACRAPGSRSRDRPRARAVGLACARSVHVTSPCWPVQPPPSSTSDIVPSAPPAGVRSIVTAPSSASTASSRLGSPSARAARPLELAVPVADPVGPRRAVGGAAARRARRSRPPGRATGPQRRIGKAYHSSTTRASGSFGAGRRRRRRAGTSERVQQPTDERARRDDERSPCGFCLICAYAIHTETRDERGSASPDSRTCGTRRACRAPRRMNSAPTVSAAKIASVKPTNRISCAEIADEHEHDRRARPASTTATVGTPRLL